MTFEIARVFQGLISQAEPVREVVPATIIAVDGSTTPAGRPNMTWVMIMNSYGNAAPVFNQTGLSVAGTHVLVGRSPKPPYRKEILSVYTGSLDPGETVLVSQFNTGPHAENHQYPSETDPGEDPVLVYQPALQQLKVTGNGTDLTATVQGLIYDTSEFSGSTIDLTSSVPLVSGTKRLTLVYLDTLTNLLGSIDGSPVASALPIDAPAPTLPANAIAAACVRLAYGQTVITTSTDVIDKRSFLSSDSGALPAATAVGQVLYSADGITFTAETPLVGPSGWLYNDDGILLVVG